MGVHVQSAGGTPPDPNTGDLPLVVYQRKTVLTDAQIKALPTTPIELVPAAGAGKTLIFQKAVFYRLALPGNYTNIEEGDIGIYINNVPVSGGFYNDPAISMAVLSALLTSGGYGSNPVVIIDYDLIQNTNGYVIPSNSLGADSDNKPIMLQGNSTDSTNFTGGHASNTLQVTVFYSIVDL